MLAATLALVDVQGLEALSMGRLGNALGRDPMCLYRYAKNPTDRRKAGPKYHLLVTADELSWTWPPPGPIAMTPCGSSRSWTG